MIEALSLLGGAIVRLFPLVMQFFTQKQDNAHELARVDKEIELEKLRATRAGQEADAAAALAAQTAQASIDGKWADGLVAALGGQSKLTGDKWLDRVNVSVRPILTYWWCIVLYTIAKLCLIYAGFHANMGAKDLAGVLMTDFDHSVMGSIIGFWFVDRALQKLGK